MTLDIIEVRGIQFKAMDIKTEAAHLLMIQTNSGFLGCGYFNIDTANKLNESVALVSGVSSYTDCLSAEVHTLSEAAIQKGLNVGMTGEETLIALHQSSSS